MVSSKYIVAFLDIIVHAEQSMQQHTTMCCCVGRKTSAAYEWEY